MQELQLIQGAATLHADRALCGAPAQHKAQAESAASGVVGDMQQLLSQGPQPSL